MPLSVRHALPSARLRLGRALLGTLLAVAVVQVVESGAPALATGSNTALTSESFTNATTADGNWKLPSSSTNTACLTAGTNTVQTPIPACASTRIDAAGRARRSIGQANRADSASSVLVIPVTLSFG